VRRWMWLGVLASAAGACTVGPRMAAPTPVVRPVRAPDPTWPRREVLGLALRAHECGQRAGEVDGALLTVIDYSLPSTEPRLWVIDVLRRRVLFHELVAHGERTGDNHAVVFSTRLGSRQSSLGLFRTEDVYVGGRGYSLRLTGLEPGVNDRAMERHIVMHGADYVDPDFAAAKGRLGRSWGCPALPRAVARPVIDRIKGGTAVFAYYPDRTWLDRSAFLSCDGVRVASADVAP
jgi:hypothetical protein